MDSQVMCASSRTPPRLGQDMDVLFLDVYYKNTWFCTECQVPRCPGERLQEEGKGGKGPRLSPPGR